MYEHCFVSFNVETDTIELRNGGDDGTPVYVDLINKGTTIRLQTFGQFENLNYIRIDGDQEDCGEIQETAHFIKIQNGIIKESECVASE